MKILGLGLLILFVLGAFVLDVPMAAQNHKQLILTCVPPCPASIQQQNAEAVSPSSAKENGRLRQAPHAAKRVAKHKLDVSWKRGRRVFQDEPPYDEPLDGVSWEYCGYNPELKLHLVGKAARGLFTGKLMDDRTGALLSAGHTVLFSPSQRYYLAYEQPDGQDGETLKLYNRNGMLLWQGFNGILSRDGLSVIVDCDDMRNMRWDDNDILHVDVYRGGKRPMTLSLTRRGDGKWEWLPKITQ